MESGLNHVQAVWASDKLRYLSELHLPPLPVGGGVDYFKGPLIRLNKILGGIASASGQDRVTRFTFPSETSQETKKGKGYRKIIFKTLCIKQQNTVIPWERGKKEIQHCEAPAGFLEKVCSLWCNEGHPRWDLEASLTWASRETEAARAHGHSD